MTAYFKATRTDGTSFYDSATRWRVGRITRLDGALGGRLCGPGVLHASTEPGEVLIGGSWPCRLFEVEPRGELLASPGSPYKVGAMAWKVVAELPAWRALGPNGEAVAAHIGRCGTLTTNDVDRLAAARAAAWGAAQAAAQAAAWDVAQAAARAAARDAAWDAARGAARDAARAAARAAARGAARDAAWGAAQGAARDVALALVVRDLFTPKCFATLTGPWVSAMGEVL